MLTKNTEPYTFTSQNYSIIFPSYSANMHWHEVPEEKLHEVQLYYCTYQVNGHTVSPLVRGFQLQSDESKLHLASCVIYQTPCRLKSTTEIWFPLVLDYFEGQKDFLHSFELLESSDEQLQTTKAKWFFAQMHVGLNPLYHLGYVTVLNGYLYEIYFVSQHDFFSCWRHTFVEIAKTFTINQKRYSFLPELFE